MSTVLAPVFELQPAEVVALLAAGDLTPTPQSPLATVVQQVAPTEQSTEVLRSRGILGEAGLPADWRAALEILCQPRWEFVVSVAVEGRISLSKLYAGDVLRGPCFVAHAVQPNGNHGFSFLHPWEHLFQLLDESLLPGPLGEPAPLALDLSPAELAVLAAFADLLQERNLLAAMQRTEAVSLAFGATDLASLWQKGGTGADYRWWSTLVRAIAPVELNLTASTAEAVVRAWTKGDLIQETAPGQFVAAPALRDLVQLMVSPLSFGTVLGSLVVASGQALALALCLVRTAGTLWTLVFDDLSTPGASIHAVRSSRDGLRRILETAFNSETAKQAIAAAAQVPAQPVTPVSPISPVSPAGVQCPKCGSPLAVGARFCTVCGTPFQPKPEPTKPPEPPAAPICPNCGAPVTPGARFCRGCGRPLG